jgi:hypothetical protein
MSRGGRERRIRCAGWRTKGEKNGSLLEILDLIEIITNNLLLDCVSQLSISVTKYLS